MSFKVKDVTLFKQQRVDPENVADQQRFNKALSHRSISVKVLTGQSTKATLALSNMQALYQPLSQMTTAERETLLHNLEVTVRAVEATPGERRSLHQMVQKLRQYNPLDVAIDALKSHPVFKEGLDAFIQELKGKPPFFVIRAMQRFEKEFHDEISQLDAAELKYYRRAIDEVFQALETPTDSEMQKLQTIITRLRTQEVIGQFTQLVKEPQYTDELLRLMIELIPAIPERKRVGVFLKLVPNLQPQQRPVVERLLREVLRNEEQADLLISWMNPEQHLNTHLEQNWGEGVELLQNFRQFFTALPLVSDELREEAIGEIAERFRALPKEHQTILIVELKKAFASAGVKPTKVLNALRGSVGFTTDKPEGVAAEPERAKGRLRNLLMLSYGNLLHEKISPEGLNKFFIAISDKPAEAVAETMKDFPVDFEDDLEKLSPEDLAVVTEKFEAAFATLTDIEGHEEVFSRISLYLKIHALAHMDGEEFIEGVKGLLPLLLLLPETEQEKAIESLVGYRQHQLLRLRNWDSRSWIQEQQDPEAVRELIDQLTSAALPVLPFEDGNAVDLDLEDWVDLSDSVEREEIFYDSDTTSEEEIEQIQERVEVAEPDPYSGPEWETIPLD